MSIGFTRAPTRMMPLSSRSFSDSSLMFGMSAEISSLPSLVSRATHSNSSMWIEVKMSSFTIFSEIRMESSKLYPPHGMKATRTFRPRESSPSLVAGPSAITSPAATFCPRETIGFWLMHVFWFERRNLTSV